MFELARPCRCIFVALIGLAACGPPTLEGTWLAGDLHSHSAIGSSDAEVTNTPERAAEALEFSGLDFFNPTLGWPTTWVNVRGDERPIDDLVAGRVTIAEPGSQLELVARRGRRVVGPGETLEDSATWIATARTLEPSLVLELREVGGDALESVAVDGQVELRLEVTAGIYYARGRPVEIRTETAGVALTNPIGIK